MKQGVPDLSEFGDIYELGFGLGSNKPPTSAMIKKEFQRKIIYQMSPQEVYKQTLDHGLLNVSVPMFLVVGWWALGNLFSHSPFALLLKQIGWSSICASHHIQSLCTCEYTSHIHTYMLGFY